jgi:leader peptidase (prepilin peptidase)/N-methyltransferase
MDFLNYFLLFFIGASSGSFLNLARFRIPKNQSIFFPNSFCDNCKKPLNWRQKVPLFSQIFFSSKCKSCQYVVPFKYTLIELILAILFVINITSNNFLFSSNHIFDLIIKSVFISTLLLISLIDIDTFTIPNNLNLTAYILGLVSIFFFSDYAFQINVIIYRILFSFVTYIFLEFFSEIYNIIRKKIPFGSGDSKLLAVFVIWLGIKAIPLISITSIYLAGIYICIRFINGKLKNDRLPFGPFLSLGAYLFIMLGPEFLSKVLLLNVG